MLRHYHIGLAHLATGSSDVIGEVRQLPRAAARLRTQSHATTLKNAGSVAQDAVKTGQKLLAAIARAPRRNKKVGKQLSTAQLTKIAKSVVAHGQKLLKQTSKHKTLVKAHSAKLHAGALSARKFLSMAKMKALAAAAKTTAAKAPAAKPAAHAMPPVKGRRPTKLVGEVVNEILGAYLDTLIYGDAATPALAQPDPANPGMLTDGSPDPSYVTADVAADPDVQRYYLQLQQLGSQPTTAPPRDPSTYTPDPYGPKLDAKGNPTQKSHPWDDPNAYSVDQAKVFKGAIEFDDTPSLKSTGEEASLGSAGRFMAEVSMNNSAVHPKDKYGPTSGFQLSGSDYWQTFYDNFIAGQKKYNSANAAAMRDLNAASFAGGFGPIIGRPKTPFEGLRYATDGAGGFYVFWFWDTAPQRLRDADDAARLQQAITDWQTRKTALETQIAAAVVNAQLKKQQAADKTAADAAAVQAQQDQAAAQQQQYDQETAAAQSQAEQEQAQRQVSYEQQQVEQEAMLDQAAADAEAADQQHAQDNEAALQEYMQHLDEAPAAVDDDAAAPSSEMDADAQMDAAESW